MKGNRFIFRRSSANSAIRDVWLVWLALSLVTTLPYAIALLRTPEGSVFTGVLSAYDDTFAYFAWMREGSDGHLLMRDAFTSEPQSRDFFLPLWGLLGFAARITGLSIPVIFHIARLLAALALLIVARAASRPIMKSRRRVRFSLWLYSTSGGMGWLIYWFNNRGDLFGDHAMSGSIDLNMPEAVAFRSMFAQVHFAIGVVLVGIALKLFFDALVDDSKLRAVIAGALVSLLAVVHPYMVVVVSAVAMVAAMLSPWFGGGKNWISDYSSGVGALAGFGIAALPGAVYLLYLRRSNNVMQEWLRVTDTLSPAPWEYLFGFGIVAALGIAGLVTIWKGRSLYGRMLLIWCLIQSALLYVPLTIQRRLVEGLQLPLAIAASVAVFAITRRTFRHFKAVRYRKAVLVGIIVFASLTNLGFLVGQIVDRGPRPDDVWRYMPADLDSAFAWLQSNAPPDSILFTSYVTGNMAPSRTGLRVFFGHYAQTIESSNKAEQVTSFYSNEMNEGAQRRLFEAHQVSYVIYGPFEQRISSRFVPGPSLALVHRAGEVEVFEVR
ncbi:MAG TPA: hypothetical protein VN687_04725 [Blastocatellia bacterium]|nr:hypothetical protein [Blastocatellia bacterium]